MTDAARDTYATRLDWLVSLENMVLETLRLRNEFLITFQHEMDWKSKSVIDSTSMVKVEIVRLELKLMDIWGIDQNELRKMIHFDPYEFVRHMESLRSTVSPSNNSQSGRTKNLRKK